MSRTVKTPVRRRRKVEPLSRARLEALRLIDWYIDRLAHVGRIQPVIRAAAKGAGA